MRREIEFRLDGKHFTIDVEWEGLLSVGANVEGAFEIAVEGGGAQIHSAQFIFTAPIAVPNMGRAYEINRVISKVGRSLSPTRKKGSESPIMGIPRKTRITDDLDEIDRIIAEGERD